MEYWFEYILFKIASLLGKPIKVDDQSFNWERGKFIRICIEIDLTKPVKQGVWIGKPNIGLFQAVRYERLVVFCFTCDLIGHNASNCSTKSTVIDLNMSVDATADADALANDISRIDVSREPDSSSSTNGPWVRVTRRPRRKGPNSNSVQNTSSQIRNDNGSQDYVNEDVPSLVRTNNNPFNYSSDHPKELSLNNSSSKANSVIVNKARNNTVFPDGTDFVKSLGKDWDGIFVGSEGASSGLLLAWKFDYVKVQVTLALTSLGVIIEVVP
ncbi:hypothetical protein Cni_G26228 [Canna indica]|uniref:Zinc knuckle CX2CX4HX4C domain-containing protein n=1 Tax=Canna indica TaxID=4628 RepID=A0AAQ3QLT5_9LILI|nr:hypothetical protein Cni_G26228 [Canna indica]